VARRVYPTILPNGLTGSPTSVSPELGPAKAVLDVRRRTHLDPEHLAFLGWELDAAGGQIRTEAARRHARHKRWLKNSVNPQDM
jgi:hypothetical protein